MSMFRVRPAGLVVAAVFCLPLVTGGCGGATEPGQQVAPATPPAQASAATAPPPPAEQAPASVAAAVASPEAIQPGAANPAPPAAVASDTPPVQDYEIAGVQVALIEAKRTSGDTMRR